MINTNEALKILEDAHALATKINGEHGNVETNNKRTSAERARVSSDLLYLAHLCDSARLEVLNQYHVYKGKTPPQVVAPNEPAV